MDYLALFPAGTAKLVAEGLQSWFSDVEILDSDESALFFSTSARLRTSDAVPIAKNLFAVRKQVARRNLNSTVIDLAKRIGGLPRPPGASGFRVMFHIDGRLESCSPQARQELEHAIRAVTGLRPQPRGNCQEYWVIGRRDWPLIYLGERLPAGRPRPPAEKGALSPELSALLVAYSGPDNRDVFADPFAGSGSIVEARLATPAQKVIYNDLDKSLKRSAAARLGNRANLLISHDDGTEMKSVKAGEVSAIVTDPPWGEHDESIGDYPKFARSAAAEFARLLNPRWGRLVLLVSRRQERLMGESLFEAGFFVESPLEILVNGHPASVIRAYPRGD